MQVTERKTKNGTINAASRYSKLKLDVDNEIFNGNWSDVDTTKVLPKVNEYNFVDLFSGAGGISVGFKQAGFKKIFSIEMEKCASDTVRYNFPESIHFEKKIEDLTEAEMDAALGNKVIQVVVGGPPCQGFSVAGLRNPTDSRNQLFKEFVRVVKHIKPWFVVLENVPGILTMQKGGIRKEILKQFDEAGYPDMSIRILEAASFGVPQLRARAVFIANRFGLKNPYPKTIYARGQYKSIDSAIDDLKELAPDPTISHDWTRHSEQMEERIAKVPPGGSLYKTFRDAWKRQYRGVPSMAIKENHGGCHIHYEENRVLSAREMARLQTFPDDFIFSGTTKKAYWQVGNAVPCLLAKHIALAIGTGMEEIKKYS